MRLCPSVRRSVCPSTQNILPEHKSFRWLEMDGTRRSKAWGPGDFMSFTTIFYLSTVWTWLRFPRRICGIVATGTFSTFPTPMPLSKSLKLPIIQAPKNLSFCVVIDFFFSSYYTEPNGSWMEHADLWSISRIHFHSTVFKSNKYAKSIFHFPAQLALIITIIVYWFW